MRVLCIESDKVDSRVFDAFIITGVWYNSDDSDDSFSLDSYLINGWWFSNKFFITEQEFRDKKLTEIGI